MTATDDSATAELHLLRVQLAEAEARFRVLRAKTASERRQADFEHMRLVRTLERDNAALLEFASAVSHDIQAPLRRMQAFAEAVEELLAEAGPPAARDYVRRIHGNAARLQVLVRDLVLYARVGEPGMKLEEVSLDEVIREVCCDLAFEIAAASATVEADPLPSVGGDRAKLRLLFANLIANSLKFRRDDDPRIRITARRVPAAVDDDPGWAIDVADNGIGFEPAFSDRIFGVFERFGGSEVPGTGIGLAICRRLVEAHGGTIAATGVVGGGATVTVRLPEHV